MHLKLVNCLPSWSKVVEICTYNANEKLPRETNMADIMLHTFVLRVNKTTQGKCMNLYWHYIPMDMIIGKFL